MDKEQIIEARKQLCASMKEMRKQNGLTQADVAKLLDVKEYTISKIESGKWAISVDTLIRLSDALKFKISLKEENEVN
ncbi:MAG: helix-turn-helix transcriptional regulator [Prevotellaceae bacterium]|jgi:transcriptional regulator with XRE-family HTH domain|nr:helix-turn-helix transcriptional regulator [Prevotellaceae bacterium]